MNPLSLTAPLAALYDLAIREERVSNIGDLARRQGGKPQRFHAARRAGDRIELTTLAGYATAAGYVLMLRVTLPGHRLSLGSFVGDLDITVAGFRKGLEALGLEMTLGVEEMGR